MFLKDLTDLTEQVKDTLREAAAAVGEHHIYFGVDEDGAVYVGAWDARGRPCRLVEGWYWTDCLEKLRERAK